MFRIFRHPVVAVSLALLAVSPTLAQTTPAPTSAAATNPKAVLAQMAAAYQSLKSFTGIVTVQAVINGKPAPVSNTISIVFQKPNKAVATVNNGTIDVSQIVADGNNLYAVSPRDKQYLQQPIPPGADAVAVLQREGSMLVGAIVNPVVVVQSFSDPSLKSLILGDPGVGGSAGMVDGVAVDTIVGVLAPAPGASETITLAIGRDDHLLRRVTMDALLPARNDKPAQTYSRTETCTDIQINPTLPASTFAFVPPPGYTRATPQPRPAKYDPRLRRGAAPFPISSKDLAGKPLTLNQYRGKVLLLDFWAPSYGPSIQEMPNIVAAYNKYHVQGFDIVGISLDQNPSKLVSSIQKNHMPWREVLDGTVGQSAVSRQYGINALPFNILIGRDGKIAIVGVNGPELQLAIKAALAKK